MLTMTAKKFVEKYVGQVLRYAYSTNYTSLVRIVGHISQMPSEGVVGIDTGRVWGLPRDRFLSTYPSAVFLDYHTDGNGNRVIYPGSVAWYEIGLFIIPTTTNNDITLPMPVDVNVKPAKKIISHYPHTCPRCGMSAFVGFNSIDCSNSRCK
jgi:hypothetical protein